MDFTLTTEQQALVDSVRRFCEAEYDFETRRKLIASETGISDANWASFAELGWLGAGLSEEMGGFGGSLIESAMIAEQLGRALVLEPFLASAVLAVQTLAELPQDETRDALIGQIVLGEARLAVAWGEPASAGDAAFVEAQAVPSGDGWKIDGYKSQVLGAPSADQFIVSAVTGDGIALFLVSRDAAGLALREYRNIDNMRVGDLTLEGAAATLLAAPGVAIEALQAGIDKATIVMCAEAVGAMDAALWLTRDYLKTRKQFGVPLGTFQALQHRMADMLVEIELSRSVVYQALAAAEAPAAERSRAVSAMKAVVSSAAMLTGRQFIQLHGGMGMTEEYAIGHYYRRLFVIAASFGDEQFHLVRLNAGRVPIWPELPKP